MKETLLWEPQRLHPPPRQLFGPLPFSKASVLPAEFMMLPRFLPLFLTPQHVHSLIQLPIFWSSELPPDCAVSCFLWKLLVSHWVSLLDVLSALHSQTTLMFVSLSECLSLRVSDWGWLFLFSSTDGLKESLNDCLELCVFYKAKPNTLIVWDLQAELPRKLATSRPFLLSAHQKAGPEGRLNKHFLLP